METQPHIKPMNTELGGGFDTLRNAMKKVGKVGNKFFSGNFRKNGKNMKAKMETSAGKIGVATTVAGVAGLAALAVGGYFVWRNRKEIFSAIKESPIGERILSGAQEISGKRSNSLEQPHRSERAAS